MGNLSNDASTDIETCVKSFASDMTAEAEKIRKARLEAQKKGGKDQPAAPGNKATSKSGGAKTVAVVIFSLSPTKESKFRTPKEQAELLVQGSTKVCWSAHMADKARHVLMKVDGKVSWDAKAAFGEDFDTFKKKWGEVMKKYGLKNAGGGDGWPTWDEFHLELPDSKVSRSDERARACIEEYVQLTRAAGKNQNADFEKKNATLLKPYLKKYEKTSGAGTTK